MHHVLPALPSFVNSNAHGTDCPVELVTFQLTVPVGVAPPSGAAAGATLPLSLTPFDVSVGFAVAEIAMFVGTVVTTPWDWPMAEVLSCLLELSSVVVSRKGPCGG